MQKIDNKSVSSMLHLQIVPWIRITLLMSAPKQTLKFSGHFYASFAHARIAFVYPACVLFRGHQGGTGISGLMRGLATLPRRWIQEPSVVRDRAGRPPRGPSGSILLLCVAGVHCWEISLG